MGIFSKNKESKTPCPTCGNKQMRELGTYSKNGMSATIYKCSCGDLTPFVSKEKGYGTLSESQIKEFMEGLMKKISTY